MMKILSYALPLISGLLFNIAVVHAADKFKVCADPLNPPYSSKNKDGYENKIAELFAKKLGQELEYTWLPQRIGFIRNTLKAEIEGTDQFKCDVVMGVAAGDDLTLNTKPYYHSQYVMLIAKGRGWDGITIPEQLGSLPLASQEKLKIAMFDRGPGTDWLQQTNLLEQGVPYQSMSGDEKNNTAMTIAQDLRDKKIDIAILWGPMAAYVLSQSPQNSFIVLPMATRPNLKFDFSMAMGMRQSDGKRKAVLDKLITENKAEIEAILKSYQVPLLPIPESKARKDD
jgi:quinoprotein dehydrogenase-associated probable ABC transporter substrate-binding protein